MFSGASAPVLHATDRARLLVERAWLGGMSIGRVTSSGHDVAVLEIARDTVLIPVEGRVQTEMHDRTFEAGAGKLLVASTGRRRTRVLPNRNGVFKAVVLMIDRRDFGILPGEIRLPAQPHNNPGEYCHAANAAVTNDARHLRQLALMLAEEVDAGGRIARNPAYGESWRRLLTEKYRIAMNDWGILPLPHRADDAASARHVRLASEFMRENLAEIATLSDVAATCGISVRTLEQAFRSELDNSPRAFLTELRLQEARRLLSGSGRVRSVTEAAMACGFSHMGRFSDAYNRRFGELPSATLGRPMH